MTDTASYAASGERRLGNIKGYLVVLRKLLIRSAIAVAITTAASLTFARHIFYFFTSRAPSITFIYVDLTGMVSTYLKVCFYSGLVLAIPFFIYEILMLIRPALAPRQRRYLFIAAPVMLLLFLAGAAYTYYIFIPPAFRILLGTQWIPGVVPKINIASYISFVAKSLFWIGLLFELPVVMFFLARLGMISHRTLLRRWRWAVLGSVFIAGILTPTGNPFQQSLSDILWMDTGFIVSGPVLLLYFFSIMLAWLAWKSRQASVPAAASSVE